jgi:hypothetical protein
MDSDHITPFAQHFTEQAFNVRAGEYGHTDATLFLSFWPSMRTMNMSVYDYAAQEYSHKFSGSDPAKVPGFISVVERAYGVTIPEIFTTLSQEYLTGVPQMLGIHEQLQKNVRACDTCGDYSGNELEAFYFPPLASGDPASLAVHNSFGCYGGEGVYGTLNEVGASAVELVESAISAGDKKKTVAQAREFLASLRELLATASNAQTQCSL